MSTAIQTRRAQLLSAQQLHEQQETSGREGLANLLAAVRRMMNWLLSPFRLVARVLFNSKPVAGVSPAADQTGPTDRAADPASAFNDDVSIPSSMSSPTTGKGGEAEIDGLMKQVAENPDGGLDVEVTGSADDLDAVMPMLLRQIDQILKMHLPLDANETQVAAHLISLAESAEASRYAHRMVSHQVESALKAVVADPKYVGLSVGTIENMVRAAAKSPDAAADFGEGSAEQRLVARLVLRDKIAADFSLQMRQMAVALAPMIGAAKSAGEMEGRGKELLVNAMQAAEVSRTKLRVRHAAHGTVTVLPETLPEVTDAVSEAIGKVASAASEKQAADAAQLAVVGSAAGATETSSAATTPAAQAAPEAAAAEAVASPEVVAPAAVAAPAPSPTTVKAAATAVKSIVAGGMFGGVATVHRSEAEMEAENVVDDAFAGEEGETLVGG